MSRRSVGRSAIAASLVFVALLCSGVAALLNQTVWERALKIYVAGAEALSAMLVVFAFMLGLGLGSLLAGWRTDRWPNPLRFLVGVEVGLILVNLAVAAALGRDIAESVYAVQRLAVSFGMPLRVLYGISAIGILVVPCLLMGLTMPLAAAAAQRQLQVDSSRFVLLLFAVNTIGSAVGGLLGGFYLLPLVGQLTALRVAIACNLLAAGLLSVAFVIIGRAAQRPTVETFGFRRGRLTADESLGCWLGFLALGYEMYLVRMTVLVTGPLPTTFTAVLVCFLVLWSAGLLMARVAPDGTPGLLLVTALLVGAIPLLGLTRRSPYGLMYLYLPCFLFGWLFGQVLARSARIWGRDVGRLYALNTFGCCAGVLFFTLVGYEFNPAYTALLIAGGYGLSLAAMVRATAPINPTGPVERLARRSLVPLIIGLAAVFVVQVRRDHVSIQARGDRRGQPTAYFGRDGVIEISGTGDVYWDGLWHARLSYDRDYAGSASWLMAAIPFLCHRQGPVSDALVIGLGTGVTASALAQSPAVHAVDAYEIDPTLKRVLRDYPEGTLRVAENPKVRILWQDGRSGLALNPKRYDLITQAPTYLKQAGSSLLLSREYFRLVSSRLKPGGVFAVYSNPFAQVDDALLVRRTVADVFPYYESFERGYAIVASNEPINYVVDGVDQDQGADGLVREIRAVGLRKMQATLDTPRLEWTRSPFMVTDDRPLVEYPDLAEQLVRRWRAAR